MEISDPFAWNVVFGSYIDHIIPKERQDEVTDFYINGKDAEEPVDKDEPKMVAALSTIEIVLEKYPTFLLDPALDNLIEDTNPDFKNLKIPFPAFFINKKFSFQNGFIMGIHVIDMKVFFEQGLKERDLPNDLYNSLVNHMSELQGWSKTGPNLFFMSIYYEEGEVTVVLADANEVEQDSIKMPRKINALSKRAMFYAANICNLLVRHANMKNPQDSKKNIRIIPYYDKNDHKKVKPKYSTIRVFGELKTYVKEYNKEKRKYTPSNTPVIVRGHWRHLQSPIFKNKQGETIWIPPYIKGANSEALHSRLIKIKE